MKTVNFSETIAASDLKVGRCRQLIEFMKLCEYRRSRSFLYHIFSRFCMSCAKISGERLQDHWSSGFCIHLFFIIILFHLKAHLTWLYKKDANKDEF